MAASNHRPEFVDITQCRLCQHTLVNPRILPCIDTFCLGCLEKHGSSAKPGAKLPCPLCGKEFTVPSGNGFAGLETDSFIERILAVRKQDAGVCVLCSEGNELVHATKYCIECQDDLCETCALHHKRHKLSKDHQVIESEEKLLTFQHARSISSCARHVKPLELFCIDCKTEVCVTCLVESHPRHQLRDIRLHEEEYRKRVESEVEQIAKSENLVRSMKDGLQKRDQDFVADLAEKERLIVQKNRELKDIIDRHSKVLVDKLFAARQKHEREVARASKDLDRQLRMLQVSKAYCSALRGKGTQEEICRLLDGIKGKVAHLQQTVRSHQETTLKVNLTIAKSGDLLREGNVIGNAEVTEDTIVQLKSRLIIVGLETCPHVTGEVISVNLENENDVSTLPELPATMRMEAAGAAHNRTIYVTGIGKGADEIWRYDRSGAWKRCGTLIQGRRRHCVAFVGQTLYICGGYVDSGSRILDSIEAFDTVNPGRCTKIGQLKLGVEFAACAAYDRTIYVFGGCSQTDGQGEDRVQAFHTQDNRCYLLGPRMPLPSAHIRADVWGKYAVILGETVCFVFDFETQGWKTSERFKTGVSNFGFVLEGERAFVVGGEAWMADGDGWKRMNDIRYVLVKDIIAGKACYWRAHARLPKAAAVHICVNALLS